MKSGLAFVCLLLITGCGKGTLSDFGLGQPDPIALAQAEVERLTVQISEELKAFQEDTRLSREAEGADRIKLESVVNGDLRRLNLFRDRKRATEIKIRELMAERRGRGL